MKILNDESMFGTKKSSCRQHCKKELDSFLDSGARVAELDTFGFTLDYAYEAYRGLVHNPRMVFYLSFDIKKKDGKIYARNRNAPEITSMSPLDTVI